MKRTMVIGCMMAVVASAALSAHGKVICSGDSAAIRVNSPVPTTVDKSLKKIYASPWAGAGESVSVSVDGTCLFSTTNQTETQWTWQPLTLGNHTLTCKFGTNVLTKTLKVTALDFYVTPAPNPPMAKDDNLSITPTTRNFGVGGGGNAIITSGSGTWTAAASDPWITLNATSGSVGYPVAYTVSANTNVEQRTGYVYVSGWVHTVTQDGVGGTISPENREFEHQGGNGTITVSTANKMVWQARPNVNWINVSPTSGMGNGSVTYNVAKYDEVATRQGTLTVAGNTFTVFQYGRRMKLDTYAETRNYEAHVIPITVNALSATTWSVTPNASWISIVDAGNGRGGDLVTVAIAENPSYKARTGTVTIGTETFTVTQQGRPTAELEFIVSPVSTTASVEGANGMIAVTATPDLPWTAASEANWLTIYAATATGAGNGNVVYNASPNPTLIQRVGKITVTPEAASGMAAKTHTVTQPAAESSLSQSGYEFEASGESCSVEVSVAAIVQWSVSESLDWITVNGSISRTGPGTVVIQAAANDTVYPRSGTVTIAGKTFSVSQRARGVELEYDTKLFDTDGGYESVSIHPDGNSAWTAVASDPTWITIFQGDSGTGDGEIMYIVAPYNGDGSVRTGWIEVGGKKVYIFQRPYALSISPNGSVVKGNSGAGEFGVAADIGAVWNAIVTEPWIALVSGYDAGTGNGTVRFICQDNDTGKTRTGKIVVAGEVYTITQSARILVRIQAEAGHGGSITGSGTYDKGTRITLTAIPNDGYRFARWTGPVESTVNPLTMDADELTGIRAEFEPLPVEFTSATSTLDGVELSWNTLAWATSYRLHRGTSGDFASAEALATFASGTGSYRDGTGDVGVTYWYWVEAVGTDDDVVSGPATGMKKPIVSSPITYTNLRGSTHSNPDTYVEGRTVSFSHPTARTGYAFAGWTPARITEDMTGAQTVRANWTPNSYSIVYNANGGSGSMQTVSATYDVEVKAAANAFSKTGHSFAGWATNAADYAVAFAAGQAMTNLTAVAGGRVDMYAVWRPNSYTVKFDANGGTGGKTMTQAYGTPLAAPTVTKTGYTFAGWSPSVPATVPAGNVTYTAQWTVNKYTVTFDANGGAGGWSRQMNYGAAISAPTVTKTGYTFAGWSPSVPATVPAGNVTYTAQWTANRYTIVYNANGGTGTMAPTEAVYDSDVKLAANGFSLAGGTFLGWTMLAGGMAEYDDGAVVRNLTAQANGVVTLYARWKGEPVFSIVDGVLTGVSLNNSTEISVPAGVTSIGDYAFQDCANLMSVTIPSGVTSIGYCAFAGCDSLARVVLPMGLKSIGEFAFSECRSLAGLEMPSSVTSIGEGAFVECISLKSMSIPSGVTKVSESMFDGCLSLESVTIPDSVTSIGDYAFAGCDSLTRVVLPMGLKSIGEFAFSECRSLADLEMPSSVTSIGEGAFLGCTSLKSMSIPSGVTKVSESMFDGCLSLESVTIPDSVTSIGDEAFRSCSSLESVTIPDSVTSIGDEAFSYCSSLESVTIPDSVTSIGEYAFSECSSLERVEIGYGVMSIGVAAFGYCGGLFEVSIPRRFEHSLDPRVVFEGCPYQYPEVMVIIYYDRMSTVTFDANGGTGGKTVTQAWGTALSAPAVTKTGYTFAGWSPSVPATVPTGNATYVAQWRVNKYTVTFDANGGTGGKTVTQAYGTALAAPTVSRLGYTLVGWSPSVPETMPAGNATYVAQWRAKHQDADRLPDGTLPTPKLWEVTQYNSTKPIRSLSEAMSVVANSSLWAATPTSRAYSSLSFANSTDNGDFGHVQFPGTTSDRTLNDFVVTATGRLYIPHAGYWSFACRSDDGFSVAVSGNGFSECFSYDGTRSSIFAPTMQTYFIPTAGEYDVELVYFNRAGEALLEFSVARGTYQGFDAAAFKLVGDSASEAKMVGDGTYTIVFHRNDASDEKLDAYEFDYGVDTRLPSLSKLGWARRGFDFKGWATSAANAAKGVVWKKDWGIVSIAADPGETIDVYAVWALKPDSYAIKFIRNDGAGTWRTVGFTHGEKTRMPSLSNGLGWARRGYDFMGWELTTTAANDNTRAAAWKGDWAYVSTPVKPGETLTVYARWALKPGYYQIRFNKNDGSGKWRTLGFQRDVSTKLSSLAALGWERDGYTFVGWGSNAANASAGKVWKADGAAVKNAADEGRTLSVYAIWE